MVHSESADVARALDQVVGGDPSALARIVPIEHALLREVATAREAPWVVSRRAAISVLNGLRERSISPEQAQGWASFVRRGYVANRARGPVRPLEIAYEEVWEEAISAAVSRLDEIGDVVDGDVARGEVLDLLQLLGEQGEP